MVESAYPVCRSPRVHCCCRAGDYRHEGHRSQDGALLCVVAVALSEPGEAGADSVFLFVLLFSVASRREISSSCHRSSAARILALHHLSSFALFGNRTLSITLPAAAHRSCPARIQIQKSALGITWAHPGQRAACPSVLFAGQHIPPDRLDAPCWSSQKLFRNLGGFSSENDLCYTDR